ncbi:PKD domain-containing protein [Paludibaculum fermentans]|uniref:PKD domain-containing protein n=1 Tax=Paludibaculum fermentans TaxID=1473598 RepID=UPI003EBD6BF0
MKCLLALGFLSLAVLAAEDPRYLRERRAAAAPRTFGGGLTRPVSAGQFELKVDDGDWDTGLLMDGLTMVNRLTPPAYPVRLRALRIQFVEFEGEVSPIGRSVRLIVFLDPKGAGAPTNSTPFLYSVSVPIAAVNTWIDFPLNGAVVSSGDIYAGYVVSDPALGAGFACDASSTPQRRTFHSFDGGAAWSGPTKFQSGREPNLLVRAIVESEGEPEVEELSTDDGTIETALLSRNVWAVNRLTPARYPATLEKLSLLFPSMTGMPSPAGQKVRILAFSGPSDGSVPVQPQLLVDRTITVERADVMLDTAITGVTIPSGDFYVGIQAPDADNGVYISYDTDGPAKQRAYFSWDDGATFLGPTQVKPSDTVARQVNLPYRATVRYGTASSPELFQLSSEEALKDGVEAEPSEFTVKFTTTASIDGAVPLEVSVEGAGEVKPQVTIEPKELRNGESALVRVVAPAGSTADLITVKVSAKLSSFATSLNLGLNLWKLLTVTTIGAEGGPVESEGFRCTVPAGTLSAPTEVRLLRGLPAPFYVEERNSNVYRLEGLPGDLDGELEVSLPLTTAVPAGSRPFLAMERNSWLRAKGGYGSSRRLMPADGGTTASAHFHAGHPAAGSGGLRFYAVSGYAVAGEEKPTVSRAASSVAVKLMYVKDYITPATAAAIQGWAESAVTKLTSAPPEGLGIPLDHIGGTLWVTISRFHDWLIFTNKLTYGLSDGRGIELNANRMESEEAINEFRTVVAHELVHVAQKPGKHDGWVWMDDATATWFEGQADTSPSYVAQVTKDSFLGFLRTGLQFSLAKAKSITDEKPEQFHGYGAAAYLTQLSKSLSNGPAAIAPLITGAAQDPLSLNVLNSLVTAENRTLEDTWRTFVHDIMDVQLYSGAWPAPSDLMPEGDRKYKWFRASPESGKVWANEKMGDLSAEVYKMDFELAAAAPALTDGVTLRFEVPPGFQSDKAGILVASAKEKKLIGENWGPLRPIVDIRNVEKLSSQQPLLLMLANGRCVLPCDGYITLPLQAGLAPPALEMANKYSNFKGVVGGSYSFGTINTNIPADVAYSWNFGDGNTDYGEGKRSVTHSYKNPGTYTVNVEASSTPPSTATTTIEIAPNTDPEKTATVAFQVWRNFKNVFGQSKQACNDFKVRILDPNTSVVVDHGEALATNGYWETTLVVGHNYAYEVDYNFTLGCPDKGTLKGQFSVKDGLNSVSVEGPACSQ